jgi:hypothetical protein
MRPLRTANWNETNGIKVEIGDKNNMTFEAIPGLDIAGKVARMSAYGLNRLGEIVCMAHLLFEPVDARRAGTCPRWSGSIRIRLSVGIIVVRL